MSDTWITATHAVGNRKAERALRKLGFWTTPRPREYVKLCPGSGASVLGAAKNIAGVSAHASMGAPEHGDDRLTTAEVAAELGIHPATFRTYVMRGQAPKADGYHDKRTPYWLRSTIEAWRPTS